MLLAFASGAILAIASSLLMVGARIEHQAGTWVTLLVAIACFYPVFAVETGSLQAIAVQSVIAASFILLALAGARISLWLVLAGLTAHGLYDGVADYVLADPSPEWWGPFCIGFDTFAAISLAALLLRNTNGSQAPKSHEKEKA